MALTIISQSPTQNGTIGTNDYYEVVADSFYLIRIYWDRNDGSSPVIIAGFSFGSGNYFDPGTGWSPGEVGSSGWEGGYFVSGGNPAFRFRPVGGWATGTYASTQGDSIGWISRIQLAPADGVSNNYYAPLFNFSVGTLAQTVSPTGITTRALGSPQVSYVTQDVIEPSSLSNRGLGSHQLSTLEPRLFANVREFENAAAIVISATLDLEAELDAARDWNLSTGANSAAVILDTDDVKLTAGSFSYAQASSLTEYDAFDLRILGQPSLGQRSILDVRFVVGSKDARIRAVPTRQGFALTGTVEGRTTATVNAAEWAPRFIRRKRSLMLLNGTTLLGRFSFELGLGYFEVKLTSESSRSVDLLLTGAQAHSGIMLNENIEVPLSQTRSTLQIREPSGGTPTIIVFGHWGEITTSTLIEDTEVFYPISADVSVLPYRGT